MQLWEDRFEPEALSRTEELKNNSSKLRSKIAESEETIDSLILKIASTEEDKHHTKTELEDYSMEYGTIHDAAIITKKRAAIFFKIMGELKAKADDMMANLEACRTQEGNYNSEIYPIEAN